MRWGPLSSGGRDHPTPAGRFNLNWRSAGHTSSLNSDWFMPWYFNFGNREGLAFHQYTLPGLPASHGCVRLLERDAQWLFDWGEPWTVDDSAVRVLHAGTPVLIVGHYEFDKTPPAPTASAGATGRTADVSWGMVKNSHQSGRFPSRPIAENDAFWRFR